MLAVIPLSFAADNVSLDELAISVNEGDVLKGTGVYYFNASVGGDKGSGSIDSPYKYLTDNRIADNSVLHLTDGEYDFNPVKSHKNITILGESAKTIIKCSGNKLEINDCFTLKNITFVNTQILNKGTLNASNTIFANSTANKVDGYGNSYGGAIYSPNSNCNVYLDNCTFENTYAEYGGAIYVNGGILDIKNSNFISTVSFNYGGAITCLNTKSVSVSKSKFNKSISVNDAGGAIYVLSSNLDVIDTDFINCNASFGGAIASLKSTLTLNDVTASNNVANWSGGAVYHMYGNVKIINSLFSNNNARNGAALFVDNSTDLTIENNIFTNNVASICAGAVYSFFNNLNCPIEENNQFVNNYAVVYNDVYVSSNLNLTVGNGNYTMYKVNSSVIDKLPSYYSLIDEGLVTVAKDQQSGGSCWAFAGIAVLESCILKASGETLDLSEENMKNVMAKYSDYGWDMETNDGGYLNMIYGYLVSWLGPINDSDDRYDDKSTLSHVMNAIAHVQNILFLKRDSYTDNDAVKRALMKYGAVGTTMYYGSTNANKAHNYQGSSNPNHAVTIVGWDDTFSKSKFSSTPPGDGAWIVKNSWGPNWGNNGYFYVSYYDARFAQPSANEVLFTIILNDTIRLDKNYQYDIAGKTDYFVNSSDTVWYKNRFNATDDEYLAAVSTYFDKTYNYTASVYVNGQLKLEQSGISDAGYYTINLNKMVPLKAGDAFEVMFKLSCNDEAYFPISEAVSLNRLTYAPGISYVSYNGGENWFDLYDLSWSYSTHWYSSQVACIKAFTYLNEINTSIDFNIDFDSFNTAKLIAKVTDEYGNLLNSGNVIFTINGRNYNLNLSDGFAVFDYAFNTTENTLSALFNAEGYVSSSCTEINITIPKQKLSLDFDITRNLNNVTISFANPQNADVNLTVQVNDDYYMINSRDSLKLNNLANNVYNIKIAVSEFSIYEMDEINGSFAVDVKGTQISASDLTFTDDDFVDFNVTLTDENGAVLSNKVLNFVLNDLNVNITTDANGRASIPLHLAAGDYSIESTFYGDNDYFNSASINFLKVKTKVGIDLIINRYANNVSLDVTLSKMINDDVTVAVNSKSYKVNGTLTLSDLDNGVYNVRVYLNNDKYVFNEVLDQFTINIKDTRIVSGDLVFTDDDYVDFEVTLTDENGAVLSGKVLNFVLNDLNVNLTTDINGHAGIPLHLGAGEYSIKTTFAGDTDYFKSSSINSLKVKTNVSMNLNIEKYANNISLVISTSKSVSDAATVKVNGKSYSVNVKNGFASLALNNLDNDVYNVDVYLDYDNYAFNTLRDQFVVNVRDTRIIAGDLTFLDDEHVNFNIVLTDENGQPLSGKKITFILNEQSLSTLTDGKGEAGIPLYLSAGEYSIKTLFDGDNDYFKTSVINNLKVKANVTMELSVNRYANNISLVINMSKEVNDTVTVNVNDKTYEVEVIDGIGTLNLFDLNNGIYDISVSLDENDYTSNEVSDQSVVDVKDTQIEADDLMVNDDEKVDFNITLKDENGEILPNKNVKAVLDDKIINLVSDRNGEISIPVHFEAGDHSIDIIFEGDTDYFKSSTSVVVKVKTNVTVDLNIDKYANNVSLEIVMSKKINDIATVQVNDKSYVVNVRDGLATLALSNLNNGIYRVTASLSEENYIFNNLSEEFTVDVKKSMIKSLDIVTVEGNAFNLDITLTDLDQKPISNAQLIITINGNSYNLKSNVDGKAIRNLKLNPGNYDVSIIFDGNDNYFKSSTTSKIKVKTNTTLSLLSQVVQNNVKLTIVSSKLIDDTFILKINDDVKYIKIKGNFSEISLSDLSNGIYDVKVNLANEKDDYEFNSLADSFKINVIQTKIICNNITTYFNSNDKYVFTLVDVNGNVCANQVIEVKLLNKTYSVTTDSKGQAFINLNLPVGIYPIEIRYLGDNNHFKSSAIKNIAVKTSIILNGSSTKTYNSKYMVQFLDSKGMPLANADVLFVLGNVKYSELTDKDGYAYFTVTQGPGIYSLNIINLNNGEEVSQSIEVISRIAENKDLTVYAFSGKYYKIRLLDDNGNPVGANQKATIKIAGKKYAVKTDKNGYASLKISLINKKYTITVTYKGFKVSNKITVKPVVITSNKVFKKAKSYKFQAKLVNGKGKALKNKKITFKIKGKKYTAKTNKYGKATIVIKLKLKVGSYKIQSIYGKSKITNTIKIKK